MAFENKQLILPTSYEDIVSELSNKNISRVMMDFIEPVTDTEAKIVELCSRIRNSGKLSFLVGQPGIGKSTFLESLKWRPHVKISEYVEFDAQNHIGTSKLDKLIELLNSKKELTNEQKDIGPCCVVVNYLESLSGMNEEHIKGFFRDLNGILRRSPFLILWPITQNSDADMMLTYSNNVSGTLFQKGLETLNFKGPQKAQFCNIATRTIQVINNCSMSDFNLNTNDLEQVFETFKKLPQVQQTIRNYLDNVLTFWDEKLHYFDGIRSKLPKPNEVWFVFPYKEAEDRVKQFARQSEYAENQWVAIHEKLYEYVRRNDQKKTLWNSQRLQLAINGALKTRILYVSTNSLIMAIHSYSENSIVTQCLKKFDLNRNWSLKHKAQETIGRTPLARLLKDEPVPIGATRSQQTKDAMDAADQPYKALTKLLGKQLSDQHLNKAVAECISDYIDIEVNCESYHPWIKGIKPDMFIEDDEKQICIEFHYTANSRPGEIADYVLKKLNTYMNQLENYSGQQVMKF